MLCESDDPQVVRLKIILKISFGNSFWYDDEVELHEVPNITTALVIIYVIS
jgi:hypothetical protein